MRLSLLSLAAMIIATAPVLADGPAAGSVPNNLVGTQWRLTALDGAPVPADVTTTLTFSEEGINGNGGCNGYGSGVEATGTGITFTNVFSTMMACPNLDQEQAFFAALDKTRTYAITDGTLQLKNADGDVVADLASGK